MARAPRSNFLHAVRSDGTISSICRLCFVTLTSKPNEVELRKPEDAHLCGNFNMRRMLHPEQSSDVGI